MLIKPYIKNASPTDMRKLCSFPVKNKVLGDLSLKTKLKSFFNEDNKILIEIKNSVDKILADEELILSSKKDPLIGLYISVKPEYRNLQNDKFRFGELLRLASIIEMLENGKNLFKIYSINTAVYFHSKYMFEPNINTVADAKKVLKSIIRNKEQELSNYSKEAQLLLNNKNDDMNYKKRKEFCILANEVVKEYIKKVQKMGKDAYKSFPFEYGMDMILTKDVLTQKRAVFNSLFAKHGIDYTI